MKRCSDCGRVLPESAFNRNKAKKDGLQGICRECAASRSRGGESVWTTPESRDEAARAEILRRYERIEGRM